MNPIENVWALLAKALSEADAHLCRSRDELWELTFSIWEQLKNNRGDFVSNLINGMPNRMQKVIESEGFWIDH